MDTQLARPPPGLGQLLSLAEPESPAGGPGNGAGPEIPRFRVPIPFKVSSSRSAESLNRETAPGGGPLPIFRPNREWVKMGIGGFRVCLELVGSLQ